MVEKRNGYFVEHSSVFKRASNDKQYNRTSYLQNSNYGWRKVGSVDQYETDTSETPDKYYGTIDFDSKTIEVEKQSGTISTIRYRTGTTYYLERYYIDDTHKKLLDAFGHHCDEISNSASKVFVRILIAFGILMAVSFCSAMISNAIYNAIVHHTFNVTISNTDGVMSTICMILSVWVPIGCVPIGVATALIVMILVKNNFVMTKKFHPMGELNEYQKKLNILLEKDGIDPIRISASQATSLLTILGIILILLGLAGAIVCIVLFRKSDFIMSISSGNIFSDFYTRIIVGLLIYALIIFGCCLPGVIVLLIGMYKNRDKSKK